VARKRNRDRKTTNAALPVMRPDAAGIDIGATDIFVAVPMDRAAENVRSFPTFTQDLYALADWLAECGVKTVAIAYASHCTSLGRSGRQTACHSRIQHRASSGCGRSPHRSAHRAIDPLRKQHLGALV
jgi:hypothetical protein